MGLNHLQPEFFLIFALLPITGIIIGREEGIKINKKKLSAGFFIILLLAVTPAISFQPAYAVNNTIKSIIKINDIYPVDSASADFVIDPPLTNTSKAFAWVTFSHTGEADHSNTFRSWQIIDENTFRIRGEDTAVGNIAEEFVAYIVEFDDNSDLLSQQLLGTITSTSTGTETFTIPTAINITNSMIIAQGHNMNASELTIGNEELDRIRIIDSTTWEYAVNNGINTGDQGNPVTVIDWNDPEILVQRGLITMADLSASVTVSPPTDIDRTRSILMFTYKTGTSTSEEPNDYMVRGTIDASVPPDLVFERDSTEDAVDIAWEVIEFPTEFVKVNHDSVSLSGGTLSTVDIIPSVVDYSKTVVITASGTPFGFGTGEMSDATTGAIDRGQLDILLLNNTAVEFTRGDSTGTTTLYYQVIEFLEKDFAENPQGTNTLRQIVTVEGEYTGSTATQDFTISPTLSDISKSILFMTFSDNSTGASQVAERFKRYGIVDTTTLRIHGSNDPLLTNNPVNFTATIVEFDSSSPIFVQRDQLQSPTDINSDELVMHMSPVNFTGSNIMYNGWTSNSDSDTTVGREELARLRLLNSTTWGFDVEDRNEPTTAIANIIDWGQNSISVQRGQASLSGTSLSVSPTTDVIRNQTLLTVTHNPSNFELNDEPDDAGLLAFLDSSSPPNIIFERFNGTDAPLEINWELISFPSNFADIRHYINNQTATTSNSTSTITPVGNLSNAFAIGTVGTPMGLSGGKGSFSTDDQFGEIFGTIQLETTSTVRFERGLSAGSWDVGFQVVEFLTTGAVFNQNIVDTVTVSPDNLNFVVNKTAIDVGTSIDLETNMNITKLSSEIISAGDTISTGVIFVVNLDDTGTATDVLAINVTKLAQETVGTGDDPSFLITKLLDDTTSISDTIGVVVTFGVEILDIVTVNDLVILNVTKQLSEVASTIDDLNLEPTKVFLDTTVVVDQTITSIDTDVNEIDTVTVPENMVIDVTKLIQDIATVQDQVVLVRLIDLAINDTVIINDPSVFFTIATVIPNGTGTPAGSGGGIPSGTPFFQRLVGLSIVSELFFVEPADRVPSDFIIGTFGNENLPVTITDIKADQQFVNWFEFSSFPDTLNFDTTVDTSRTFSDPARFKNLALDDFVLNVPSISCDDLDPFVTPVPCVDPIIYEASVTFTFKKGGVEFREKHIVTIDATQPVICDALCEFVDFMTQNYWWLAGILIVFMMMYFLGVPIITGKPIRTVRRVDSRHFTSLDAERPRRKFKRGKRK